MKGRVVQYFFAIIFCVGVSKTLFPHLLDDVINTHTSNLAEISFENDEREYSLKRSIISAAKAHSDPDFLLAFAVWEIEETDDDNDASDFYSQPGALAGTQSEELTADFLVQSGKFSPVPLFILLHSWKHFLS